MTPTPFVNPGNFAPARFTTINSFTGLFVDIIFVLATLGALVYLVIGAFKFITADGQADKITSSRKTIVSSIFGIIIIFTAFLLVRILTTIFEVDFLL